MQKFKGDDLENKFIESGKPILDLLSTYKTDLFNGCYSCQELGQIIHEDNISALAKAIPLQIFRETFSELFSSFQFAGTFEAYLDVFRKIFGDQVEVDFTIPAVGKLEIEITSSGNELNEGIARQIESNVYVNYNLIDDEDDNIMFSTVKGFTSQYDLEQMLFEMTPNGVYTTITLTIS